MPVTFGWGPPPRRDVFTAYWVLALERGEFVMHLVFPPHRTGYQGVFGRINKNEPPWDLDKANALKAVVCPICLWDAIAPGQLAVEHTTRSRDGRGTVW